MEVISKRIGKITINDPRYPELLKTIENPPSELYYRGNLGICDNPCLAIVGSRKATPYGRWAAYNIAKRVSEHGVTIVSGLATGIDACGHIGALDAGGETIAVLGCGPDVYYPRTNRELMKKIDRQGLIITEYPPGTAPISWQFPARNRIISGLSYGVLVVEADLHSGSLITAGRALEQGREVFAVPGNINCIYSRGTNKLIQDGATPLTEVDDILDFLNIRHVKSKKIDSIHLGKDEENILKVLYEYGTVTIDRICLLLKMKPQEVAGIITILEIKGKVKVSMGKIHVAK